jgi:NADPH:quinone reductase-like Zn-dependent oxidoreductase
MRAAYLTGHGGMDVVVVGERPQPMRQRGQVRVKLHAATVNRVDLYMRDSGAGITHTLPLIMGVDGAGVIDELDDDEPLLRHGQRVVLYSGLYCGRCEFCLRGDAVLCTSMRILGEHTDGCFAQYVCVPAANALPIPDAMDFASAAALGVNHLTAWRMLFTQARLKPWETACRWRRCSSRRRSARPRSSPRATRASCNVHSRSVPTTAFSRAPTTCPNARSRSPGGGVSTW